MNEAAAVVPGYTPGICYALAYFISACVIFLINKRKLSVRKTLCFTVCFAFCLFSFMMLTDGVVGPVYVLSILLIFGMIFLFLRLTISGTWQKALYFAVQAFIMGEFAASFEWQMFYYAVTGLKIPADLQVSLLFLLVLYSGVFGIFYLIGRHYRDSNDDLAIDGRELAAALFLGIVIFFLSNMSFATPNSPFSSRNNADIYAMRTLADLGGVGLLLAYHIQLCESSARMEKEYLHKLLHMQKENYRISEESVALVNQKYHDLKHQIQLLRSEISSDEKLRYLDEMEEEIRSYEAQNKTGSKTLDTLLTAKSLKCQSLNISLTCVADGAELDFMKPTDLSVLFGNALDNAIESVAKISDADKRLIHLSVSREKGFLRIRIENCYEGEINFVAGLPSTGKDARYHGYGMKSIRSIVEKYNGSMTVKAENSWFELRVLFPVSS